MSTTGSNTGRYDGRIIDMQALLTQPVQPVPWRCDQLIADGFHTIIAGRSNTGKSFLALALAGGVHHGAAVAGIDCARGHTVYFDAENGAREMRRRFHALQLPAEAVTLVDAAGLTIARDLAWMHSVVREHRANLVVFDSLRRLAPGMDEDRSNDTAPIVSMLSMLARDTQAAVLTLHHRSTKANAPSFRGSSAIQDQADLLFTFDRAERDTDKLRRKLATEKCRIEREPDPRWLKVEHRDGFAYVEQSEATGRDAPRFDSMLSALRGLADETIAAGGLTRAELSTRLAVANDNGTFIRALGRLRETGEWEADDDTRPPRYQACWPSGQPLRGTDDMASNGGSA